MKGVAALLGLGPAVMPSEKRGRKPKMKQTDLEARTSRLVTVQGHSWVLERGVDMSAGYRSRGVVYPFRQMEVGEAVFIRWSEFSNATLSQLKRLAPMEFRRKQCADPMGVPGHYIYREK